MDRAKTMERLKKRAEFLAVAGGPRVSRRGFVLQKRDRREVEGTLTRFGFTVTKKMGNSPERNRIRRRLREAVRLSFAGNARAATDYVLVGRRAALSQPFEELTRDLISGFAALERPAAPKTQRAEARDAAGVETESALARPKDVGTGSDDRSSERPHR
jgi:ribonuclease P protein component